MDYLHDFFHVFQLQWLNGDIVCLQEVDPAYFAGILEEVMLSLGYKGLFMHKSPCTGRQEGVALFFKKDKFELEQSKTLVINDIASDASLEAECQKFGEVVIFAAVRHKITNVVLVTGKILSVVGFKDMDFSLNTLIPMSDHNRISPSNISTMASRQVTRLKENIK